MKKRSKIPWPTKAAMMQVYEKNLWGGGQTAFYSGVGSHDPNTVQAYVEVVCTFFKSFKTPPTVCDLGCGDFNIGSRLVSYTSSYKAIDIVPDLIARNKKRFQSEQLSFGVLDIAKDPLPKGDCALLRQVLQHLSNAEIQAIVGKLYDYTYVILTEHLPDCDFEPNKDIISGQGIRLKKQSGVDLLAPPFNLKVQESKQLLKLSAPESKGSLVTTLYKLI
ncbi:MULTISPECIES: class I SAM-dependent methyltransferase [unclassified Leeuwenhoekiella]|uniref:class I SAM-dependent methyltransferase n=1 Tax=unclassified Leeuwenhoekiella TaxID=2615029 RepID=UPI000C5A20FA|nr:MULTISPECIES: class I SAM-dependent methyltransferase [unclassified Leeuwenhoekiella]MAW94068.1 SAM-dependent methyltransferase [Leeuwenhoekiella sp.]MBA80893.1 SAM-dependent methyltransferase [Leeuwenhoekiella sp.]|tara:strand:+ start:70075 stop:70734 length:660 start_codon:yes stop_codon:yes gene_type:complete